jgi:outer membrane protein assembly factor BamB
MKTGNLASRKFQLAAVLTVSLFAVVAILFAQSAPKPQDANNKLATDIKLDAKQIQIDLDKAAAFDLPEAKNDLTAVSFKTPDGKQGWVMRIPGSRPIATPAYADGMIFVGGGYGSHEFYAIDAETGRVVWQMQTKDDGPTAAVVEDGCVAFNTESCTVIVAEAKTGKVIWQEWLGDPLMSQPAISKGRLYIAYPAGQRGAQAQNNSAQTDSSNLGPRHRMLCADLKTGRHLWEQKITADVISAPVVSGDQVLFTCFDGVSFCLDASTGAVVWKNAQGKYLNSIKAGDGKFAWRAEIKGKGITEDTQVFSPPALGERNLYLCGAQGHIVAVKQKDGAPSFAYSLKQPMVFQPALAKGNIYAGTVNGLLICLKTGDKDADGWYAWGGNAQHNKQ